MSRRDFCTLLGAGFAGFGNSPFPSLHRQGRRSPGSGIPPPGSPGAGFSRKGFSIWIRSSETGGAEFSFAGVAGSGFFFPAVSESSKKLWIAGSLHREGRRRSGSGIPPPGSPESGIFAEAGFSTWERGSLFGKCPGSGIPPPGSPGSGKFDWGSGIFPCQIRGIPPCRGAGFPRRGHRRAGFSTGPRRGSLGSGIFLCGSGFFFPAVLVFPSLSCCWGSLGPFTEKDDEARGERDSPARVTRERDFRGSGFQYLEQIHSSEIPPHRATRFRRRGHRGAGNLTGSPAGALGSGIFPRRGKRVFLFEVASSLAFQRSCGSLGPFTEKDDEARGRTTKPGKRDSAEFCPTRVVGSGFFSLGESSLAFQRSCGSLGPFTEKDDDARGAGFPRQGHQRAGFSRNSVFESGICSSEIPLRRGAGFPRRGHWERDFRPGPLGSGIFPVRSSEIPLVRERDSPARVTGERDFRRAEFSPAGVAGSGFFSLGSRFQSLP